jgi:hypothetical protein
MATSPQIMARRGVGDMGLEDVDEPFQERIRAEGIADRPATLFLACCVIVG